MLKKSTKEIIAYSFLAASIGVVVFAIHKGTDLIALAAILPSLVMVAWRQKQRSKEKREHDDIVNAQKCSVHNEEVLAGDVGSTGGSGDVHPESAL